MLPDPLGLFRQQSPLDNLPDPSVVQEAWRLKWRELGATDPMIQKAINLAEGRAKATARRVALRVQDITYRSVLDSEYQVADAWVKRFL